MGVTEQYFPRGGKKPKETFNERKKFDFLGNADRIIGKKRKYRAPKIEEPESEDDGHISDVSYDSDEGIKSVSAEAISEKTLQEGMVILGRVMNIFDTKVIVSLPGRLTGVVMASHISPAYTKLLKSFVDDEIEDMKRLPDILKLGEYVSVRVLSVVAKKDKRNMVTLSIMPQDVNKGIYFNTLKEGMLLPAAVDSIEDHGYVVDLGIPNCRTFLPSKFIDSTLNAEVGQVIWCVVKKCQTTSTNSIVTVSNSLESIQSTCIAGDSVQKYQVTDLRPGMAINFNVNKPLPDGAEGCILANSTGYIHVSQIGAKLHVGKKVKARLLYIMPITKFAFFTTRKIFETFRPDLYEEANIKVGQIIENAQVTKVTDKSVIFKFDKAIGIMKLKQSGHNNKTVKESYSVGSQHTVRIMYYHPSDYAYICSDARELLEQKYFNMNDLSVGEIVDATVDSVTEKGVTVKLGTIKGWIPELHVSDVALFQATKTNNKVTTSLAAKLFKPGQEIKARVLKLNPSISVLHLTAKPMLLDPELFILSKYEDAKVGYQYKGVIVHHLKFGVLVAFFGEVKAVVQKNQLSHEPVSNIPAVFLIGQVVNCTILSVDAEGSKINGSFIKSGLIENTTTKKSKKSKKRKLSEKETEEDGLKETKSKKKKDSAMSNEETIEVTKKKNESVTDIVPEKKQKTVEQTENKKKDKKNKQKKDELKADQDLTNESIENGESKKKKKIEEPVKNDNSVEVTKKLLESGCQKKDKKKKEGIEELGMTSGQNDILSGQAQSDDNADNSSNKKKKKQKLKDLSCDTQIDEKVISKKVKSNLVINDINTRTCSDTKKEDKLEPKFSSMGNFWDLNASTISKNISKVAAEVSSSESDTEKTEEKTKKKKKRLTAAEKVEKARQEEEKLREIEQQLSAADSQPQSSDQFERLLLANPNSSELWIAYMAFHLQATEIERARAVGRKALKTISFREELDKLNVWLAMLNIENRFGTKESLTITLQEALQMNNPFDVHSKMLDMYLDTGKIEDLQSLVDTMVAKYRNNPQTYIMAGEALYKLKLVDKARSVMQKAVSRLENKAHIPVLIKFAHMENNHGDSERAEALFEQIVGCLPQRVDIWCVYVDMLLKSQKIDSLRLVFERAVSQKLPLRKMKTLYKKWVEIEEKLGNTEQVERIRQMAMEFINKVKC